MSDTEEQPSKIRRVCREEENVTNEADDTTINDSETTVKESDETVIKVSKTPEAEDDSDAEFQELSSFFENKAKDLDDTVGDTNPIANSTLIESDATDKTTETRGDEAEDDDKTLINSLNSFLEEAEKEKEAEKPEVPKKSQSAKSAGENEALGKETVDKTEKDSSSKEEKAVSVETKAPLSKTVLIEGIEIDIDELLKRDDDEDQYWDNGGDFDLDDEVLEELLEGTQLFTFDELEDNDDLVNPEDISALQLPLPVPARGLQPKDPGQLSTAKPPGAVVAPKEVINVNPKALKNSYFQKGLVKWKKDLEEYYSIKKNAKKKRIQIPQSPHDLDNLRFREHPSKPGKYYWCEDFEEWSDRCHPLWQEYRDIPEGDYARFIHHIWGFDKGIDVTRNLSRFSKIIPPGNDQPNIVEEEAPSRLACQYCEMVCFCSSGKLHKKPYLNPRADVRDDTVPSGSKRRLPVTKKEFQLRVLRQVEKQTNTVGMQRKGAPTQKEMENANRKVMQILKSAEEAFELAVHYRSSDQEITTFSDDQVKELLALEQTLEAFKIHYKSPYDDADDDDEDEEEETSQPSPSQNESKETWGTSVLEDY